MQLSQYNIKNRFMIMKRSRDVCMLLPSAGAGGPGLRDWWRRNCVMRLSFLREPVRHILRCLAIRCLFVFSIGKDTSSTQTGVQSIAVVGMGVISRYGMLAPCWVHENPQSLNCEEVVVLFLFDVSFNTCSSHGS